MIRTVVFAVVASSALWIGAAVGAWRTISSRVTSALLAFASGALMTAVAYDLIQEAFDHGGAVRAGGALAGGAVAFALLAGVTLDGVPENLALGVSLIGSASTTLLVAIFASNLPEALVGAQRMRKADVGRAQTLAIWGGTGVVLAIAVVVGFAALDGVSAPALAWPLGFAGGAVLASLADTLMPEAYREGGPLVALATALGFLLSFFVSSV